MEADGTNCRFIAAVDLLKFLTCRKEDPKFVYYLSAEFLMGRSLLNVVSNQGLKGAYADALSELGANMEVAVEQVRYTELFAQFCSSQGFRFCQRTSHPPVTVEKLHRLDISSGYILNCH